MGKFKHLKDDNLAALQGMVDKRYRILQALCGEMEKAA
jgi:hypothetical protein